MVKKSFLIILVFAMAATLFAQEVDSAAIAADRVAAERAAQAYMKISQVQIANFKNGEFLSEYGSQLYASDMRYMMFKLLYDGLETNRRSYHDIKFSVRVYGPGEKLVTGRGAPEGYSAAYEMTVAPTKGEYEEFPFRGRGDTSIYKPGTYRFEFWFEERMLFTQEFTLLVKPGEATYLTVDGESDTLRQMVSAAGDRKVYTVSTDGKKYWVDGINNRWVTLEYLPENQFSITFKPDFSRELKPYEFSVTTGNVTVPVKVGYTREGLLLYNRDWVEPMLRVTNTYDFRTEKYTYKGEHGRKEICDGYGMARLPDEGFYLGQFRKDLRDGMGIYFIAPNLQMMMGPVYFVGNYKNSMREEQGRLYDAYGKMIYEGPFHFDKPVNKWPMDCDPACRFECHRGEDGSMYLGETKNGQRHGYGILFFANGDAWYGRWENDKGVEGFYAYVKTSGVIPAPLGY